MLPLLFSREGKVITVMKLQADVEEEVLVHIYRQNWEEKKKSGKEKKTKRNWINHFTIWKALSAFQVTEKAVV